MPVTPSGPVGTPVSSNTKQWHLQINDGNTGREKAAKEPGKGKQENFSFQGSLRVRRKSIGVILGVGKLVGMLENNPEGSGEAGTFLREKNRQIGAL